ncbi:MAG: succinate--CoA ligase subunit alpha [Acidobacteria bacterium]|nr:succinate--CoA ligase subunit alpha [Acidobacteriota bacterium]
MSILIDENKKVIVQGITGREGSVRAKLMLDYGTHIVGGCTPGRGGQEVHGLPVFDTVRESVDQLGKIDVSVIFVPAPRVKAAAIEAFEAGIPLVALIADRVPLFDVLEICEVADELGAKFVGPNTVGVMSPEKAVLGMMGGRAETAREWFHRGPVGIMSRSGGLSASTGYYICRTGIGISTICHVGGDAVIGLTFPEIAGLFEDDAETETIVMIGEIGGTQEEQVADLIEAGRITKPVVAYIGGKSARAGTRYSHAGAIIEGGKGTWQGKVDRLREVGAVIVDQFGDIFKTVQEISGARRSVV